VLDGKEFLRLVGFLVGRGLRRMGMKELGVVWGRLWDARRRLRGGRRDAVRRMMEAVEGEVMRRLEKWERSVTKQKSWKGVDCEGAVFVLEVLASRGGLEGGDEYEGVGADEMGVEERLRLWREAVGEGEFGAADVLGEAREGGDDE